MRLVKRWIRERAPTVDFAVLAFASERSVCFARGCPFASIARGSVEFGVAKR